MLTRRDWLKRIIAVPIAAAVGAKLAHEQPTYAYDRKTGIAIRFIRQYDIEVDRILPHRLDVWLVTSASGLQRWPAHAVDWAKVNGCMFQETISYAEYRKRFAS